MVASGARALVYVVAGLLTARILGSLVERLFSSSTSPERATLARRAAAWGVGGLALASALRELGFDLSVLLGAAGVVTVAVGFASQTSASNLISGLFLVFERPFSVGDVVQIGATSGEVLAIDLLSVKLRTFENLYVRMPNEAVMKAEITNLTRFPIRRIDLPFKAPYSADLEEIRGLLIDEVARNPCVLDEPGPDVMFLAYGPLGVELKLTCWASREVFFTTRREVAVALKRALDAAGVQMPQTDRLDPRLSEGP